VGAPGAARGGAARPHGELRVLTTRATPQPGEPAAVHPVAGLLAVGGAWYAARPSV
jgi:hypothetical protein